MACINELHSKRMAVQSENAKTRQLIAAKRQELDMIIAQQGSAKEVKSRALALNRAANSEIKDSLARLKQVDGMIADHQNAIGSPENAGMQKGDWNAELAKLRETRAAINAQISELKQQEAYSAQLAKS